MTPSPPLRLLLIEDNDVDAANIERMVTRNMHASFRLERVASLGLALERIEHEPFDAVLLDLGLPDSFGGVHAVAELRKHRPDVNIVVLTGTDNDALGVQSLAEGAQDYITKAGMIADSIVRSLLYAIERGRRSQIDRELAKAEQEFQSARMIQQSLFPQEVPPIGKFDLAGRCEPANAAGGDYYDYFLLADGTCLIAIGDVSGHSLASALVSVQVRTALRTMASTYDCAGAMLSRAVEVIRQDLPGYMFTTLFLGQLNPKKGTFKFAGAGERAYWFDKQGKLKGNLNSMGAIISDSVQWDYHETQEIQLCRGDMVLLVTDGIPETKAADDMRLFSRKRVLEVVSGSRHLSAQHIVDRLFDEANKFAGGLPAEDDYTAVVLKCPE